MADTKTCALWREQQAQRSAMWDAFNKQATEEFPPGTKVRWTHTFDRESREPLKREGVVKLCSYGDLKVQIKPGGPLHRVGAHLAEIIEPAPGVKGPEHG